MADPLLSVCIPHIGEPWLADCIASVKSQGLEPDSYEIITVEDVERRGAGWTRNRCFEQASGEYIMCLDADDLLPTGTLPALIALRGEDVIVCPAAAQFFNQDGLAHRWTWYESLLDPFQLLTMPHTPMGTSNAIYPRLLHEELGGFPVDCGGYEHWAFFARAVIDGYRYRLAPDTYYLHRLHPDSYWCTRPDHRADLQAALVHVYADRLLG